MQMLHVPQVPMGCRETQLSRALYGGDGGLGPVCSVSLNEPAPGHCQKCDLLGAVSVMRKLFFNMYSWCMYSWVILRRWLPAVPTTVALVGMVHLLCPFSCNVHPSVFLWLFFFREKWQPWLLPAASTKPFPRVTWLYLPVLPLVRALEQNKLYDSKYNSVSFPVTFAEMCFIVFLSQGLEVFGFRMFWIIFFFFFFFFKERRQKNQLLNGVISFFFSLCNPKCKIFSHLKIISSVLHDLNLDSSVVCSGWNLCKTGQQPFCRLRKMVYIEVSLPWTQTCCLCDYHSYKANNILDVAPGGSPLLPSYRALCKSPEPTSTASIYKIYSLWRHLKALAMCWVDENN